MPEVKEAVLEVNSIVYHKLTGEPVFVLALNKTFNNGVIREDGLVQVRRYTQGHEYGSEYRVDYFRPEELVNVPSQSPQELLDALFQKSDSIITEPPPFPGGLQS